MKARRSFVVAAAVALVLVVASDAALADQFTDRVGDGPLNGLPTFFNTTTLDTTPTEVALPSATGAVKCKLVTPSTGTNAVAWSIVVHDEAAPTITADYDATTGASIINPGAAEIITLQPNRDLYVVAAGAGTSLNVTCFAFNI